MTSKLELVVEGVFESSSIAAGFDDIGDASKRMANDVDTASRTADDAVDRMGSVSEAADGMGSSASQAAGGLGDLGGALGAMPGPLGALGAGMETVAPLVMGVTGATDLMTLAMNSNIVVSAKQAAANALNTVKTVAMSAAQKAAAVAQWALNAAMSANPIGLVVIAVAALVGGLILAYQKSETFRNVVNAAMDAAKAAVDKVVGVVGDLIDPIVDVIQKLPDMSGAFEVAKTLVVGYFDAMTLPLRTIIGLVEDLIDWIAKIDFPDLPHIPGTRVAAGTGGASSSSGVDTVGLHAGGVVINIRAQTLDGRTLDRLTRRYGVNLGGVLE